MTPKWVVKTVQALDDYKLLITFHYDEKKIYDMKPLLEYNIFKPLKNISDNYPKYVITMDDVDMSHDGIIHLNLIDFLMDNEVI